MQIEIIPSMARGTVSAPPSKSMAHRRLICAGLCDGVSRISGIAPSEDVLATLDCLAAIGAEYKYENNTVEIRGVDPLQMQIRSVLPCRECGSTLRFFIPVALLSSEEVTLTGSERLLARPQVVYEDTCRKNGLYFHNDGERITVRGTLKSGVYEVRGDVSSQFISGLLFVLPLLEGDSEIRITGKLESRPYIDLTLSALADSGVEAMWGENNTLLIRGGQRYQPREAEVEGDYSNAAFFEALNYVGGEVTVTGLREDSLQGDRVYTDYFKALAKGMPTLSIGACPDLGPILFAVAATQNGGIFTETARLRIKESDRGAAMAEELAKLGARVTVVEDRITVSPANLHPPAEPLCGHNDHRIVMSLAVLLARLGGVIDGAEAVKKSMPDFFDRLRELGVKTKQHDIG
ncbi:MAG: 3-phosphoshikimate 1-carboxyvinyltransferase [Clostridia bacterium]|nr:3-phosphoshikimate 1-carboxyvinyltransferase [Clostridia bacterium]